MNSLDETQIDNLRLITNNGTENFWQGYSYIKSTILGDPNSDDVDYWLGKAIQINSNLDSSTANSFIRSATVSGLRYSNKTRDQEKIQANSDIIGRYVINEVLSKGLLPPVDSIVDRDVSAAIKEGGQTIGGWGGAFYYWNVVVDGETVGQQIKNNLIEYDKFITAAARASVEVYQKYGFSVITEATLTALGSQADFGTKTAIAARAASYLRDGSKIYGDVDKIFDYTAERTDGIVTGWKYEDDAGVSQYVTDSKTLAELNSVNTKRQELAGDQWFNTVTPLAALKADGALRAMKSDSEVMVGLADVSNQSFAGSDGQQHLLKLASWYAGRLATTELFNGGGASPSLFQVDSQAKTLTFSVPGRMQQAIDHASINSLGKETQLDDNGKLDARKLALSVVSSALDFGQQQQNGASELEAAIKAVWDDQITPFATAANKLDHFVLELAGGQNAVILANNQGSTGIVGGNGNDTIVGTSYDDIIVGGRGIDTIRGGDGADIIFGGADDDVIYGGAGGDFIDGGGDNDIIYAGELGPDGKMIDTDDDVIVGGSGNDHVYVGGGYDVVALGDGEDHLYSSDPNARTVIWGGAGKDTFHFSESASVLVLDMPELTLEDYLKLDAKSLFAHYNFYLEDEYPYTHIIVNLEAQDEIYFDGINVSATDIITVDRIDQYERREFVWNEVVRSDGWRERNAYAIDINYDAVNYREYSFEGHEDYAIESWGNYDPDGNEINSLFIWSPNERKIFSIEGFKAGDAGLNLTSAPYRETQTITEQYNISVQETDSNYSYINQRVTYWPEKYTLVGDPTVSTSTTYEGDLKPDTFDTLTTPTVNIADYFRKDGAGETGNPPVDPSEGSATGDQIVFRTEYVASASGSFEDDRGSRDSDPFEVVLASAFAEETYSANSIDLFSTDHFDDFKLVA